MCAFILSVAQITDLNQQLDHKSTINFFSVINVFHGYFIKSNRPLFLWAYRRRDIKQWTIAQIDIEQSLISLGLIFAWLINKTTFNTPSKFWRKSWCHIQPHHHPLSHPPTCLVTVITLFSFDATNVSTITVLLLFTVVLIKIKMATIQQVK